MNKLGGKKITDVRKLELLQEIFNSNRVDGITGIWTDGLDEVIVFTEERNYKVIVRIIKSVAELFDMYEPGVSGGALPLKSIEKFKNKGSGYYVG